MFKGFLKNEGMDSKERRSFPLKIKMQQEFFDEGLIIPKMKKAGFEDESRLIITREDVVSVTINLIPRVVTIDSDAYEGMDADRRFEPVSIPSQFIPLLDWDRIYYDIVESIAQKGYFNITFSKDLLRVIITDGNFSLYCPPKLLEPKSIPDLKTTFTDVVTTILKKTLVTTISKKKSAWLMENLEVELLSENHDNFTFKHYCIMINENETEILESVKKITEEELNGSVHGQEAKFIT